MVYMYEPFTHTVTKTTLKHLHHITDIPLNTLCYQKENGVYNEKLRCFFTESLPRLKKKQEFNEKVSPEYEIWKYSDKYDLYVSNLGRMRLPNGKFKFGNGCKGVLTVIYKNKKYRAADIVFETFIKNLKSGYHAYPKDSKYNNITADNLFSTTFKKYRLYRKNDGRAKALYLIDSNNEIVEEFASTVEASSMLFIDRRHIARRCNNRCVNKGLMYMWADEYKRKCVT